MKKYMNSLKKVMVLFAMGAVFSACQKYAEGVSEFDPTQPTDASLAQVVNSGQVAYIGFMEGELARIAGMWSSQFTGADRQYVTLNNYTSTAPDYDNAWGNIYAGALKGFRIAQQKATVSNNKRALAMMQILEAHTMVTTASVFGDIPYSQANNLTEFPNPAFDKQLDVYNATLSLLNTALANIAAAPAGTTYEGNVLSGGADDDSWIAIANTLKAKIYLHLGQYANAMAAAKIGIKDASMDLIAPHGTIYNADFNVYYSFMNYDRPGYLGAADALAPRLLDSAAHEYYRGNAKTKEEDRYSYSYITDENYTAGYELNFYSEFDWGIADGYFGTNTGFPLVTYRENQLILAEATLRTSDAAGALKALNDYRAYLNGGGYLNPDYFVTEDSYLPYLISDFAAGGIENEDGIATNDALYREIIQEKYISMLGTIEVFNDMRRNGFGSFASQQNWQVVGITPNTGSQIPQRFIISQAEINSNTSAPTPTPGLFQKTEVFK